MVPLYNSNRPLTTLSQAQTKKNIADSALLFFCWKGDNFFGTRENWLRLELIKNTHSKDAFSHSTFFSQFAS